MFTADICKMYRQIEINIANRPHQHIMWRKSMSESLCDYELNTVTHGVTSSPFQAIRVLHQLEEDDGKQYHTLSKILSTQTYVDDIISGYESVSELLAHQAELTQLLAGAGFVLKKWSSNCNNLLAQIPEDDQAVQTSFDPKEDVSFKILGLHWDPVCDTFGYHTTMLIPTYTKRTILSIIAKLYDSIGALNPIILWAKSFMQLLWQAKFDWDDPLRVVLSDSWKKFASEII